MPPKKSNIGRRTRHSQQTLNQRAAETDEQRTNRLQMNQQRNVSLRASQTEGEREAQNTEDRLRMRQNRATQRRTQENLNRRIRLQTSATGNIYRAAFNYNNTINYSLHTAVNIGTVNKVCNHCKALKFKHETPGMCCVNGKIKLPVLNLPPDPLRSLLSGTSSQSKHFLTNIQTYNSCFQMTSFGATNIIRDNFMPTFKVISSYGVTNINCDEFHISDKKTITDIFLNSDHTSQYFTSTLQIQGQIYHKAGSLLPFPNENYQFLQIYVLHW